MEQNKKKFTSSRWFKALEKEIAFFGSLQKIKINHQNKLQLWLEFFIIDQKYLS